MNPQPSIPDALSRRDFLKSSTGAVIGGALASPFVFTAGANEAETKTLKIGLIGCGGRGTGAAGQALNADKNVQLVAVGDAFPDRIELAISQLKKQHEDKVQVPDANRFVGLDAYKKVLASDIDVVLLATPPGFRPLHLQAAVDAGKHIFCEKPMAVDAPGVHKVIAAAEEAKQKKLSVVAGFCWRRNFGERETFKRIHDGQIGDVRAHYGDYLTGSLWSKPRQPGWSDFEFQLRNWLYYTWLSGDHLVEQAVHSVDKMSWVMRDVPPLRAIATGGRQVRTDEIYGHIYDHFNVRYDYADGVRGFISCRQQAGCFSETTDHVVGSKGYCEVNGSAKLRKIISGGETWNYNGPKNDMYQTEHDELFASIRLGQPINDGPWMTQSTMIAIMGRMSAYTGQAITWDEALHSKEDLTPASYDWNQKMPIPPVAMPGRTKFV